LQFYRFFKAGKINCQNRAFDLSKQSGNPIFALLITKTQGGKNM